VVEGVGLVASGFQFFTRLTAVFAEEIGGFESIKHVFTFFESDKTH
jgi:hypothetical protein